MLEHDPLGTIVYPWQANSWVHHYSAVVDAAERLEVLAARLVEFEVRESGIRSVWDDDYLSEVYRAGVDAVVGACLAMQHLSQRVESYTKQPLNDGSARERLLACTRPLGIDPATMPGYDALTEVLRVRRAVEHPSDESHYNSTDGGWDQVLIAWMLSNRAVPTMNAFIKWFETLVPAWDAWTEAQPKQPGTLTVGMRGVSSTRPAKKAPQDRKRKNRNR